MHKELERVVVCGGTFTAVNYNTKNEMTFRTVVSKNLPATFLYAVIEEMTNFMGIITHDDGTYIRSEAAMPLDGVRQQTFRWIWNKIIGGKEFPACVAIRRGR